MADKKTSKAKELDEKALDAVQGGLWTMDASTTEVKRVRKPGSKGAPTPDGFIIFSETGH
jgi:bacteriocin-like protein